MNIQALALPATPSSRDRRLGLMAFALFAVALLAMLPASARADDDRGISGTVMSIGSTSMRVAIKDGLKTVYVDANTKIKNGRDVVSLSSISPGDRVSATVETIGRNQLLASKVSVRGKSTTKQVEHLTGVVIERDEDSFRLASRNGRTVDIELEADAEPPAIADVVTTIVENDLATGRIKAKQIQRVEQIVARLEESLSRQVDKAKADVLKKIIDESARQHLDTLNQTLDQVEDEAREKIEAALEKFRADYAAVAERVGNEQPEESYQGVIAELTSSSVRVSSIVGDGSRTFEITSGTVIFVEGLEDASTADLVTGQEVSVSFIPSSDESDPTALLIEALPPALPPVIADEIEDLSDGVIEGDVIVVEEADEPGSVIVIIEEDGSGDTVGVEVTPDTDVTVDGEPGTADEIQPDQQVEVTVGDDGVTADSVVVTTEQPAPTEQSLTGIVTAVDGTRRVIVVTPTTGPSIRLSVPRGTTVTLNGSGIALGTVEVNDIILDTSRYIPESGSVTRLAVARTESTSPGTPVDDDGVQPTPTATPGAGSGNGNGNGTVKPAPFSIKGVIKSFDGDVIVFDGMTLPKSAGILLPEGVAEGSEVDLVFTVLADGTIVLTGIQAQ